MNGSRGQGQPGEFRRGLERAAQALWPAESEAKRVTGDVGLSKAGQAAKRS
jgi:hypothetical protein